MQGISILSRTKIRIGGCRLLFPNFYFCLIISPSFVCLPCIYRANPVAASRWPIIVLEAFLLLQETYEHATLRVVVAHALYSPLLRVSTDSAHAAALCRVTAVPARKGPIPNAETHPKSSSRSRPCGGGIDPMFEETTAMVVYEEVSAQPRPLRRQALVNRQRTFCRCSAAQQQRPATFQHSDRTLRTCRTNGYGLDLHPST